MLVHVPGSELSDGQGYARLELVGGRQRRSHVLDHRVIEHFDSIGLTISHGGLDHLTLSALELGGFLLAHGAASDFGLRWGRSSLLARRSAVFLFVSAGTVVIESSGPMRVDEEGGLSLLLPSTASVELEVSGSAEMLLYAFDMSEVTPLSASAIPASVLPSASPLMRGSYAFLKAVAFDRTPMRPGEVTVLKRMLLETARALIEVSTEQSDEQGVFAQAQRIIANESASPSLDPARIAAQLGLSRRTLFRAFAEEGRSVAEEIRSARTRRAIDLLVQDPQLATGLLASQSGFGSVASLQRALRETGHGTLSALRAELSNRPE